MIPTLTLPVRLLRRLALLALLLTPLLSLGQALSPATLTGRWQVISESSGQVIGSLQVRAGDGPRRLQALFDYKDNGRGPTSEEWLELAEDGTPRSYRVSGTGTYGNALAEQYRRADGRVSWQSPVDRGDQALPAGQDRPALYVAMGGSPLLDALAVAALAQAGAERALPLWPSGRLVQQTLQRLTLDHGGRPLALQLLAHTGLGLSPTLLWASDEASPRLLAMVWPGWGALVAEGHEALLPQLRQQQLAAQGLLHRQRVADWLQPLPGLTLLRNARVFDSATARLLPPQDLFIAGGRITAMQPAGSLTAQQPDTLIDAAGRVLLPGLYDMHAHSDRDSGVLHLAAGVTTLRDMGNGNANLQALLDEAARGQLLHPRVVPAGFIEGASPFSSQNGRMVRTLDEAKAAVDWYAQRGYTMVKIYNSFPREHLAATVAHAHARGLRVGGHVPAFLRADEALDAGFDEISHVNQLLLNFLVTPETDTRTLQRFYLPAERLGTLDLDSPAVQAFIARLKARGTVADLTLMTFQFLQQRDGEAPAELAEVMAHLPPDLQRGLRAGQMKIPDEATAQRYRAAVARLAEFAGRLYRAGVPLVAGTDHIAGLVLHSELIGYVQQAGLTPAQALQIATHQAARISGTLADRGQVAPGRLADLLLVEGDPTQRITDLRRVSLVITQGGLLRPRRVHQALGLKPFVEPGEEPLVTTAAPERR
ncbi:MAG: amidohydrolase family protein [Burkholderiaceae bacterium]|nr:amidohydrolase family protein [Burkholderiaceae bacterium]